MHIGCCKEMKHVHWYKAILAILSNLLHLTYGDFEYVVSKPESLVLSAGYETSLSCEMNIPPDRFQWKFYPLDNPYDSQALINLSSDNFKIIPQDRYRVNKKKSELQIELRDTEGTGDYQCLAYYGASVVASVPWRITLERMEKSPPQENTSASVHVGNTVSWKCEAPKSNPEAYIDYKYGNKYITSPYKNLAVKSMILTNVTVYNSGTYSCLANNGFALKELNPVLRLEVVRNGPPRAPTFIIEPKKEYTVTKGSSVFLDCSAVGQPVPKVSWSKKQSVLPSNRSEENGGLIIRNITSRDDGVYVCTHTNAYGTLTHEITVKYNEEPTIDCSMNMTDVNQGENMDIECIVKGTPEPQVSWFLNGFSVLKDAAVEAIGNRIYFRPVEKRHAGNLQIFARNVVKTVYKSIIVRVIPLSSSIDDIPAPVYTHPKHHHRKPPNTRKPHKMTPPSRPIITRLDDETVMVRWSVPNNNGLAIQFFKVQYKEIGPANHKDTYNTKGSVWNTANTDVRPNIKSFDIRGLKPDYIYKFRVAAVYSNDDSKMSPTSKKFHLRRLDFDEKNPLPVCPITYVQTLNHTAVKIYWECPKYNVSIDGFYISYLTATQAGDDYMKSTVEGESTRSYIINYLQPETSYDIKLQSFNSKLASEFSPLMKGKTGASPITAPTTVQITPNHTKKSATEHSSVDNQLYIVIVGVVIVCAIIITAIVLLFVCRKWKRKKLTDTRDKPSSDHHIQSDVDAKTISRSNGCVLPGNKITITSNPLADAENKKFLARIFSRIRT
ncbi:interference hedgehog-like isoform X2 [Sitophilus oryzae]|uniref:Interference hedgehog n=1 Tax=Sitophilus oryzae TaxID=7048 RepID=A0A6J2YV35_SITOR|nr:interference hedgehog-like isoform X2 [Sitophilus oryzae]